MTRQPDLLAGLRELAPEGYGWLCVTKHNGVPYWQITRGDGCAWIDEMNSYGPGCLLADYDTPELSGTAIELKTGTIHLQAADGSIIEVPRSEWEKIP